MQTETKKILKLSLISILFLVIAVFVFFNTRSLVFGIKIKKVAINGIIAESTMKVTEGITKITGNAKNAVKLSLNGRDISIDQEGNFNETLSLLPGYNVVNIVARDKFGHVDEKNYQLMY